MGFGGPELYPALWDKAATYYEGLAKFHVFLDGNKRTAFAVTVRFLRLNGFRLRVPNKQAELFTLRIIEQKLDMSVIASWLQQHSVKGARS